MNGSALTSSAVNNSAVNNSAVNNSAVDGSAVPSLDRLLTVLADVGPQVVAFSGGVDSSLLAVAASRALPQGRMLAATADSPSLANGELDECRAIAAEWGFDWRSVKTDELADDRYVANEGDRCYWCKSALMDELEPIAAEHDAVVTLGVNLDDLGDHRPGQEAAAQRGARFPLVEAGLTKAGVRTLARQLGLSVWDRPAMPCLSSRIPYGTAVTVSLLSRVDRAEQAIRALGFGDLRVRHYGDTARIELPAADLGRAATMADDLVRAVTATGYDYVTLDLAGLRSGNLNTALGTTALGATAPHESTR
ncbi:MAG: ATP-dependent sacrificial sulfur transferase LarE [Acidimicrobiales bacterium]